MRRGWLWIWVAVVVLCLATSAVLSIWEPPEHPTVIRCVPRSEYVSVKVDDHLWKCVRRQDIP